MALKDAPLIEVLKFDEEEAYNPDRRISSLIRTQLLHLHHAENLVVPPEARTNININHLLTERQACEYIQKVTPMLHLHSETNRGAKPKEKKRRSAKKADRATGKKTSATKRK